MSRLRGVRAADGVGDAEVERAVTERVVERAHEWFPDCSGVAEPRVRLLSSRPRARLYAVALGDDERPRILVKTRRDAPAGSSGGGVRRRPSLSASPLSAGELAGLEYAGLRAMADMVAGDARFVGVRPLDHLPEHATVLMDFVAAPTLRSVLVRGSRLLPRVGSAPISEEGQTWERVGAWLAAFHGSLPSDGLPPRQQTKGEVVEMFLAYDRFLSDQLGAGAVRGLGSRGAELATSVLPETLPLAVGHGDFAPRNVFRCPDGRLAVFDPLVRWAVPPYEDLCRFLVNVRLMGPQLHSRGAAHSVASVEALERAVIGGYRSGGGVVPTAALRCYELLVMLDKWSALADVPSGMRGWLRQSSLRAASGFLRDQAGRVVELADAS